MESCCEHIPKVRSFRKTAVPDTPYTHFGMFRHSYRNLICTCEHIWIPFAPLATPNANLSKARGDLPTVKDFTTAGHDVVSCCGGLRKPPPLWTGGWWGSKQQAQRILVTKCVCHVHRSVQQNHYSIHSPVYIYMYFLYLYTEREIDIFLDLQIHPRLPTMS